MKVISDERRLKLSTVSFVEGKPKLNYAGDAWQHADGRIVMAGLWDGLIPLSQEDHMLMAAEAEVSPLQWLYQRLVTSPLVKVEVVND